MTRAATMAIADEQDLERQRGHQHGALSLSLRFGRSVGSVVGRRAPARPPARARDREFEGDKKGEMRTDAAVSMSNLVVKTCARERERERRGIEKDVVAERSKNNIPVQKRRRREERAVFAAHVVIRC